MSIDPDELPVAPIQQIDIYGTVRERLQTLIDEGGYKPGDRLASERRLAEALNVSRMVVREAMKVLEYMGKVEIRHGAGTFVRSPGRDPITVVLLNQGPIDRMFLAHLTELRAGIEVKVVELATRRAGDADWEDIKGVLERNETDHLSDPEIGSLNLLFEAAIGRATRNPALVTVQRAVHEAWVEAWGRLDLAPSSKHRLHEEHQQIFELMRKGDADAATTLMSRHVDRTVADARVSEPPVSGRLSG